MLTSCTMDRLGKPTHEHAVRVVLASLERSAARYQRHIVPFISLSMDFYVRMFVRVYTRPEEAKRSMLYAFSGYNQHPPLPPVRLHRSILAGSYPMSISVMVAGHYTSSLLADAKAKVPPCVICQPLDHQLTDLVVNAAAILRYPHTRTESSKAHIIIRAICSLCCSGPRAHLE